jgi:hypothetical protein
MRLQVVRQLSESVLRWWFLRRGGARKRGRKYAHNVNLLLRSGRAPIRISPQVGVPQETCARASSRQGLHVPCESFLPPSSAPSALVYGTAFSPWTCAGGPRTNGMLVGLAKFPSTFPRSRGLSDAALRAPAPFATGLPVPCEVTASRAEPCKDESARLCCSDQVRCVESKAITLSAPEHAPPCTRSAFLDALDVFLLTCRAVVPPLPSAAPPASSLLGDAAAAYPPSYRCARSW